MSVFGSDGWAAGGDEHADNASNIQVAGIEHRLILRTAFLLTGPR